LRLVGYPPFLCCDDEEDADILLQRFIVCDVETGSDIGCCGSMAFVLELPTLTRQDNNGRQKIIYLTKHTQNTRNDDDN
jgi:hypothetical protein